jgi:hypothetical protein
LNTSRGIYIPPGVYLSRRLMTVDVENDMLWVSLRLPAHFTRRSMTRLMIWVKPVTSTISSDG